MSQRTTTVNGNPVITINATTGNETYLLPGNYAPGRTVTVRREDSSGNTVTVTLASGQSLDGVTDATATIAANSTATFEPVQVGVWESYGLTAPGGGSGTPTDGSVTTPKLASDVSSAIGGSVTSAKTSAYTAAVGQTVPVDASGGAVTITLPAASRARDVVVVKKIDASANAVTIQRAGSDVINTAATSVTLTLQNQSTVLRSSGAGAWIIEAGDLPLSAVAATFVPVSSLKTTITYNGDGTVNTVTETVSGAVTTYTYNVDGSPATESRVLAGVTTLRTFAYSGGNLVGVS